MEEEAHESRSNMELFRHFSHDHPLLFFQDFIPETTAGIEHEHPHPSDQFNQRLSSETNEEEGGGGGVEGDEDRPEFIQEEAGGRGGRCYVCSAQVEVPFYRCNEGCSNFYLHKRCAELELGSEINHPFHPPHPLSLLSIPEAEAEAEAAGMVYSCSFCRRRSLKTRFLYGCKTCGFYLDIHCAFLKLSTQPVQHFSHHHPLFLCEELKDDDDNNNTVYGFCAAACSKPLCSSGAVYICLECRNFKLHKECAELPLELNHPFHQHPLLLLPKQPYSAEVQSQGISYNCSVCWKMCFGFVYHCFACEFGLDVDCAHFQLSTITKFPRLQHFSHQHSLLLLEEQWVTKWFNFSCIACQLKITSGAMYKCLDCNNYRLHKKCAELPHEINHPFHPHPLTLLKQSPCRDIRHGVLTNFCRFCHGYFTGFVYRCNSCNFDLDVNCASLQLNIAGDFHKLEHFSHEHPLVFVNEKSKDVNCTHCTGCQENLSGPFYRCLDCNNFDLHKECAELPREINHPYHRKHPLTLLLNPPMHPEKCSCYWCKVQYKGFIYYCSSCDFGLNPENVSLPRMITVASHEHPWVLLSACVSFICNFCGTDGDCAPYVCTICDLLVHKNCISLPQKIRITRHHHTISHTYLLQKNLSQKWDCRICHDEVNSEYGSYCCFASNCDYIAHVKCATDGVSWDEEYVLEENDERPEESMNLITDAINMITIGEDEVATEIKHAYHGHYLILNLSGEVKDDNICDGCMRNISLPFYSCEKCGFFLHRHCAELPRVKQHAIHKHQLTLRMGRFSVCVACNRFHHGFSYICDRESCDFKIDIQCSLLPDSLIHPSHEHRLLITHDYEGDCCGCNNKNRFAYRCKERCGFALGFECITLPHKTQYKYDRHPLILAYYDDSDHSQCYCDICEEKRHPSIWFYHCADCDNSVHLSCVLGDLPFVKLGSLVISDRHQHIFRFVRKIWNSPPCRVCGDLCSGQALECTYSGCNYVVHFQCELSSSQIMNQIR